MTRGKAPVALFVYNRPDHTRQTLRNLSQCVGFADTPLYIFCDGAKNEEGRPAVLAARQAAREVVQDRAVFVESDRNRGLAKSIISGVTDIVEKHGRVIVLEDDLLVQPLFLEYMNACLDKYEADERIMQVSGYMFPVDQLERHEDAVLLPFTVSWGWATWRRAWLRFDPRAGGAEALQKSRELRNRFNLNGAYNYHDMLKIQLKGKSDSWAIRWYWSVFKSQGAVVFPPRSFVRNAGFDGSGTHGWRSAKRVFSSAGEVPVDRLPRLLDQPAIDPQIFDAVTASIRKLNGGFLSWLKRKAKLYL